MKICPVCKSNRITLYMGGHFGKYQCNKCNYIGNFILEKYEKEKKSKEGKKKI